MNPTAGHRGEDVRNDCFVELTPGNPAVQVASTVGAVYLRQIESEVKAALARWAPEGTGAIVEDFGAFTWCLEARVEAAARKLPGVSATTDTAEPHPSPKRSQDPKARIRRTRLYLPGNTPKFFVNAALYGADSVILDLEDAVPESEKDEARSLVCQSLRYVDFGAAERMVRINSGVMGMADARAAAAAGADVLLVPKAESAEAIEALESPIPTIPLIESARGLAHAAEIAMAPGVVALAVGVEDYLADIGGRRDAPEAMAFAYGQIVNAARSAGLSPLASVYADIDDLPGFRVEVKRMISLGFDGVGCLHPSQVPVAQRAFAPTPEEEEWARQVVAAFEDKGGAVAVNGKMIDAPVAARARRILERAVSNLPAWRLG